MEKAEFDKFAEEYRNLHQQNIGVTGESTEFFAEYKIEETKRLTNTLHMSEPLEIVDFGSGVGNSVPYIKKYFPNSHLTCLDVSSKSLDIAQHRFPGFASYQVLEGPNTPFEDNRFDLIFTACVFHHIDHSEHKKIFQELLRILKPNGLFVIFEHNPLNPLTRRAVNTCPLDENATLISARMLSKSLSTAGFCRTNVSYRIFFPGFMRRLRWLEQYLKWLPLGGQYYVSAHKKI